MAGTREMMSKSKNNIRLPGGSISVNRHSPVPTYYQILQRLKGTIEKGYWKPGEALPSEQELAELFSVTKLTVRRAIHELVVSGMVIRSQGRHSRVAMPKFELNPCSSLAGQAEAAGLEHHTIVLACKMIPVPRDIRKTLQLTAHSKVLHISRIRWLGVQPVAVEDNYLVESMATPFREDSSRAASFYESLKRYCGLQSWKLDADIEFTFATQEDAAKLESREGRPLLSLRSALLKDGSPFGFTYVRFVAERFHFRFKGQEFSNT